MGGSRNLVDLPRKLVAKFQRWRSRPVAVTSGVEPIALRHLISPLRYDVLARCTFFELLRAEPHLLGSSPDAVTLRLGEGHPYLTWFRHVNCSHHHPRWLQSADSFQIALENRVTRNRAAYTSILHHGFDCQRPIRLSSAAVVRPTKTGKRVRRRFFLHDGAHRIAILLSLGEQVLLPEQYVIVHRREYRPLDNTSLMMQRLDVSDEEYFGFLSLGYLDSHSPSGPAFMERLDPTLIDEVRALMRIDGRSLRD